jgi:hypothetical protein
MAEIKESELAMDAASLYREDVYTDRRLGTIRQLTPVGPDGSTDPLRPVLFTGQAHIMTPAGTLPVAFEIEAATLGEAAQRFAAAAKDAIEDTLRELQELRRQAASQIVVPDAGTASQIVGPGGIPGGKIRMP